MPDNRKMNLKFASRAVHAGERPAPRDFVPIATPIYASSSFVYDDLDQMDAALGGAEGVFVYSRYGNPTVEAMESAVAALEEQDAALGVGSGMAAVNLALLACAKSGNAHRRLARPVRRFGEAPGRDLSHVGGRDRIRRHPRPRGAGSGPESRRGACRHRGVDFEPIVARDRHRGGRRTCPFCRRAADRRQYLCNSGAASPRNRSVQTMSSTATTKYLGGHGDVTSGVIAASGERRAELNDLNKSTGGVVSPFDAWLVLRGIKTLPLRMERQCRSAAIVADWLFHHPKLEWVYYPGLPGHESHRLREDISFRQAHMAG